MRVRCSDFSKLRVYAVYSNRRPPSLFGEHWEILRWRTLRKTLKIWWGQLEKRWRQSPAGTRPGTRPVVPAATAGDETAATCEVMYTDEGELEFDEDEMAALEGQRLVAVFRCEILFSDSGSEPNFEGFHASEPAGNLSGGDDSGSKAITESDDDEGVTGRLSDAAAAAAYLTNPNLPD